MNNKPKRAKAEFNLATVLANTTVRKQVEGFVEEIILHKRAQKTAAESVKDIVGQAKDQLAIPGKILMKLVRESMDPGVIEHDLAELEEVQKLSDGLGFSDSLGNNARGTGAAVTGSQADGQE